MPVMLGVLAGSLVGTRILVGRNQVAAHHIQRGDRLGIEMLTEALPGPEIVSGGQTSTE